MIYKKIFILISFFSFSFNILAEEILMKCKNNFYTYVSGSEGPIIYSANIKSKEKKRVRKYCPLKVNDSNKHMFAELKDINLIVNNYKAICNAGTVVYTNGNKLTGTEIVDFRNPSYSADVIMNGKKYSVNEKCKIK